MAESPKRPADVPRTEASRVEKPSKPVAPANETSRAADSVPSPGGPFTTLPTQFGRYRIEKMLGKGAMGAVYLAHDVQLDRSVALKVARVSTSGSAKLIKRMETEAKAAANVDHPQICKVYDFGEIDGVRFIALQYIEGEDFKSYLKRVGRKREPAEAVRWIVQLARALKAAHDKGVIHRDLKPENVMLNPHGEPVIMDFGLARRTSGSNDAGLTQGMVLGTAAYMSPEQAVGKADGIDHRSDLYSLGVMLFEMLTGEWPFTGGAIEVMGKKCVQEAPSPLTLNPDLPPQLAEVSHKLIATKKEDRYATCVELVAALEAIDLKAPVAVEQPVEIPATASFPIAIQDGPSFEFLDGPPAAPVPRLSVKARQESKQKAFMLASLAKWWRGQLPNVRWTILGTAGACVLMLAAVVFFRSGDTLVKKHADLPRVAGGPKSAIVAVQAPPSMALFGTKAGDVREITLPGGVKLKHIWCPPGTFTMGSPASETGRNEDEDDTAGVGGKQVEVTLTNGFWLAATETTQEQYIAVMGTSPWVEQVNTDYLKVGPNFPACYITYTEAEAYCAKLTEIERQAGQLPPGWKYALPTEAQWEYACRAGTTTAFSFGDDESRLSDHAWWGGVIGGGNAITEQYSHTVGTKRPNLWGFLDMHGNVWEWCREGYQDQLSKGVDPFPTTSGVPAIGVCRGGSWRYLSASCRSANRDFYTMSVREIVLGFRIATVSVDAKDLTSTVSP